MSTVQTAAIVGVGLIGGSLAAGWRAADFAQRIIGIDAAPAAAAVALERGLVDEIVSELSEPVDIVAVCTSSDQIATQVAAHAASTRVIIDVGSVKAPILTALADELGGVPDNYIACHPIAGSEQSGPGAARADLFAGSTTVVTPLDDANTLPRDKHDELTGLVMAAWQAVDSQVVSLSAVDHDEMLAVTSHLPHLLAFAFMQQVEPSQLDFTGGGFRDFTRIAAADPELWWRILSMNKDQVLAAASAFTDQLENLTDALQQGDAKRGVAALQQAASVRRQAAALRKQAAERNQSAGLDNQTPDAPDD